MNGIVLFEDERFVNLLPLVFWRTVFELRVGRKINLDRIAQSLELPVAGVWTRDWIAPVARHRCQAPVNQPIEGRSLLVNGRWLTGDKIIMPEPPCVGMACEQVAFVVCDDALARRLAPEVMLDPNRRDDVLKDVPKVDAPGDMIDYPWNLVTHLGRLLEQDWKASDAAIEEPEAVKASLKNRAHIHIGSGTTIDATAVISADAGPVYISENVHIGPHAVVEGPIYIGPQTRINPHAWLHGPNAIGPFCKIGGEVDGCLVQGYTNKQHHGFLGHACVGSWVNLGAGTSNSDLKNTYGKIKVPIGGADVDTGLTFFGCVIGDHVKTGINSTIPTGAVLGMAATAMTTRVLPKFLPSFAWLTDHAHEAGDPCRLLDVATRVMARRNVDMTDDDVELFLDLGDRTRQYERPTSSTG